MTRPQITARLVSLIVKGRSFNKLFAGEEVSGRKKRDEEEERKKEEGGWESYPLAARNAKRG